MPEVGDRVRVESTKLGQAVREGVVTEVLGHLLRVRWSTGEESTFTPGPGSVSVVGKTRVRASKGVPRKKAPSKKAAAASSTKGAKAGSKTTTKAAAKKNAAPRKAR